jgi:hypothetical protein
MRKQTHDVLASQAFIVLASSVEAGREPPLIFYERLAGKLGMSGEAPETRVGNLLDHLGAWLAEQRLPDLSALVINRERLRPGSLYRDESPFEPLRSVEQWWEMVNDVCRFDWSSVAPPTPEEVLAAYKRWRLRRG